MDKLIISSNSKAPYPGSISQFIGMLIGMLAGLFIFVQAGDSRGTEKTMLTFFAFMFFFLAFIEIYMLIKNALFAQTKIDVYEDEISGKAIEKSPFYIQDFKITHEQISNVDVAKKYAVVLYTSHTKYTCYAKNAEEVQKAIMNNANRAE